MLADIKSLNTGPRELRKFGLVVGGVFALLALLWWFRGRHFLIFAIPSAPLLLFGLVWPQALRYVYIAWMSAAFALGAIVSTVLLTFFYYLVVTPVGLTARACGKDFLGRRFDRSSTSYWIPRESPARKRHDEYEQQF